MDQHYDNPIVERQKRHHVAGFLVITAVMLYVFWTQTWDQFISNVIVAGCVVCCPELIWRFCLLLEELNHTQMLRINFVELIKRTIYFNARSTVLMAVVLTSVTVVPLKYSISEILKDSPSQFLMTVGAFIILLRITKGEECTTWEAHTMRHFNGLDYGSGMAHSFFYGYLDLILPAKEANTLSVRDRIIKYMEKEGLTDSKFPVKKLVILIPSSGYSFPKFSDDPTVHTGADPPLRAEEALQDHLRNRAGTKARVYRGGAYRVTMRRSDPEDFMYILAEGPTALLTFSEACRSGSPEAEHLRIHKVDIVSNFYRTLKELINRSPECRNLVDLIYYNDENISEPANVLLLLQDYLTEQHRRIFPV